MPYEIVMIYINITNFLTEKDHSMIETRRLKNLIFFPTNLSFGLPTRITVFEWTDTYSRKFLRSSYRELVGQLFEHTITEFRLNVLTN